MPEYGTLLDFSAGFPTPQQVRDAGHRGVVSYVSDRRRDAQWMGAKPLTRAAADAYRAAGLDVVSCYQYGKTGNPDPPDWMGGYDAGVRHARRALELHTAAGGDPARPIYAPVDDNPTLAQWNDLVAPFLRGWESVAGHNATGVYLNARCIEWALEDGLGSWYWQHNWSGDASLNGHHPAAHLHQVEIDKRKVGGIGVDLNVALRPDFGQWSTGSAPAPRPRQETPVGSGDFVWLADVLRDAGLKVWELDGWKDRGHGDIGQHTGVGCHHTAGGGVNDWKIVAYGRSDLPGPLAHLTLERDGTFRVLAAGVCWHAGRGAWPGIPSNNANAGCVGIEGVNNGVGQPWTPEQLDAYPRAVAAILRRMGLPASRCWMHREWSSEGKIDPTGIDGDAFRGQVQRLIDGGLTAASTPEVPDVTPEQQAQLDRIEQVQTRIIEQLCGPGVLEEWRNGKPTPGWPQFLGTNPNGTGRTMVEAFKALGEQVKASAGGGTSVDAAALARQITGAVVSGLSGVSVRLSAKGDDQ